MPVYPDVARGGNSSASIEGKPVSDLNEFSVYQFFDDESYELQHFVSAEEAVKAAKHYTETVGAHIGITRRVIIMDGDDSTNFEWRFGEGITQALRANR